MPRKTAGTRYPHATTAARQHDHRMCPVIGAVAERAKTGTEDWGTTHQMPPLDGEEQAKQVRTQLFNGRNCKRLAQVHGPLSVSVTFLTGEGQLANSPVRRPEGYVLVVRVWSREQARAEIARRVEAGEKLHYNVMREKT